MRRFVTDLQRIKKIRDVVKHVLESNENFALSKYTLTACHPRENPHGSLIPKNILGKSHNFFPLQLSAVVTEKCIQLIFGSIEVYILLLSLSFKVPT